MNNSKIVQVIKTFSPNEVKGLEKFLKFKFGGTDNINYKIFSELKKGYPDFKSDKFSKNKFFARVYRNKPFTPELIRKNISMFMKCLDEYLMTIADKESERLNQIKLLEQYRQRGLIEIYKSKHSEIKKKYFDNQKIENEIFYSLYLFQVESRAFNNLLNKREESGNEHKKENELLLMMMLEKLNNYLNHKAVFKQYNIDLNTIYENSFLPNFNYDAFINSIDFENTEYGYMFKIIYYSYMCSQNLRDYDLYIEFKNAVMSNLEKFNDYYKFSYLTKLINVTTPNQDNVIYAKDRHIFFKTLIQNKYYVTNFTYLNIVIYLQSLYSAIKFKDYDYAEELLNEHINFIIDEHRENLYNFSMSYYLVHLKKYKEALEYNLKIKLEFLQYRKVLNFDLFEIYYELNYFENAYSVLDSFKNFVKNESSLDKKLVIPYTNYIAYARKLINLKINLTDAKEIKNKADILLNELNNCKDVSYKNWLQEKFKELI